MAINNISNNSNFSKLSFKNSCNDISEYEDFSSYSDLEKFNLIINGKVDTLTYKDEFCEFEVKFDGVKYINGQYFLNIYEVSTELGKLRYLSNREYIIDLNKNGNLNLYMTIFNECFLLDHYGPYEISSLT